MARALDKEMVNCYLTMIEAVDPEAAERLEAAYEHGDPADDEELAGDFLEVLDEHGLIEV